ncbi:hypothetical protein [Nonomuraea sp. B19D2]|uniref:hypothetical protein n=1 Tax=Nonomuraea sp. B19D2 TaxID=3159561 RepID=UPI0032DB5946
MKWTSLSARLPLETLTLAARHFLPLAFFYTAGRVVHDLVLVAAAYVGDVDAPRKYLGFAVMSLAVLATLAAYVAMLRTLKREQPAVMEGEPAEDRLPRLIAHTLLPFLAFYGAWGLFGEDVRQYSVLSQELFGVQQIKNLEFNPLLVTCSIAVAAFLVRVAFEKAYERARKARLALATTVFEAMWMFFAVISVEELISGGVDWVTSRTVWAGAREAVTSALSPVLDAVGAVLPEPKDVLLLPLVWLTIAAVVFGREAGDVDAAVAGTRVEQRAGRMWTAAPAPVRNVAEFVSRDLRGKYLPMIDGLRVALRAGAIFYLTFCLCYLVLEVARKWVFIGVLHLVGPHESAWWTLWHGPIQYLVTVVYEVLRISLLAAALGLALGAAPVVRNRSRDSDGPPPSESRPLPPEPRRTPAT